MQVVLSDVANYGKCGLGEVDKKIALHAAGEGGRKALEQACKAAEEGAAATKAMEASAGRSSYVPEEVLRDVPDPGAQAVCVWLKAILSAMQ